MTTEKRDLGGDIAEARYKVLSDSLKSFTTAFSGRGPKADQDDRAEAKEMISRIMPQCVALQCAMVSGDFPLDKELFDCIEKLLDRGMGKATQPLSGDKENPLVVQQTVHFDWSKVPDEELKPIVNVAEKYL